MNSPAAPRPPNYDKFPAVPVPAAHARACWLGWPAVLARLDAARGESRPVVVECYPGVDVGAILRHVGESWPRAVVIDVAEALRPAAEIERLVAPDLGGDDPVFGRLSSLRLAEFFDAAKLVALAARVVAEVAAGHRVVLVGAGASLVKVASRTLVYADMPRWEGQLRQRRGEVDNLGTRNRGLKASLQYKRSFFIDWRVADRRKRETMATWDFLLDTTTAEPRLMTGEALRATLAQSATRPFRLVPFFDPGPWGGQWMRRVCDLPEGPPNYAWCFDCVPEENSLLLEFAGGERVEIPASNLVFQEPKALLGEAVYGRFGAEFPIRFDFLDTMGGGNLSLQVHPTTDFARDHFGLNYTQDESYYILEAEPAAEVLLGRRAGARMDEMFAALERAHAEGTAFDDAAFAARFPARAHDHFLIPAGTLHCSGAGCMVLEISATPYIFTFKLWDWNRLGLDGRPRPVNLARGREVIDWSRDEDYARRELVNAVAPVAEGEGWREERTGLHASEFIETRRHWFTASVHHARTGGVEVLNLVAGEAAVVESMTGAWPPFEVHYAETFVIPAAAGDYVVRPLGEGHSRGHATIKAYVRTRA